MSSFREAGLEALALGNQPCFAEKNEKGQLQSYFGLQDFLFFVFEGVPIFVFDNHNHALACRYRLYFQGKLQKGAKCLHLDQHSDLQENPFSLQEESWEAVCEFVNECCNVGNFLRPALETGLLGAVEQIRTEYGLLHREVSEEAYLLDIDLDFWAEEMSIQDLAGTLEKTKKLIR